MAEKRGNKGEWSEIYVLLKLLGDKELYAADADLNKIEDIFYPILSVIREESGKKTFYEANGQIKVKDSLGKEIISLSSEDFKKNAKILLAELNKKQKKAFACQSMKSFLKSINCNTVAKGGGNKKDIEIKVHDAKIASDLILGFSIKSLLGKNPTLFNAGETTNFVFELKFKTKPDIEQINRKDPEEIFKFVKENTKQIDFIRIDSINFCNNLILIDTSLPEILAEMLLNKYLHGIGNVAKSIQDLTSKNPLSFPNAQQPFYTYKIKAFLTDAALGMTPSKIWKGTYDATGGIIVVRKDGEIVCYHTYNRNQFQDYLLNNTKLDQASTSRHKFGHIYKENRKFYIKLNLQVRFI